MERTLARLYDRIGSRVVIVAVCGGYALGAIAVLVTVVIGARYLELSQAQTLSVLGVALPIAFVAAVAGFVPSVGQFRTALAWSGPGRTAERAPDAWYALAQWRRVVTRAPVTATLAVPPVSAYVLLHFHEPGYLAVTLTFGAALVGCGSWVLVAFSAELLLRPMLQDVAVHLPPRFQPVAHGIPVRAKALGPLPVVTLFAALLVGAYANLSGTGAARVTLAVGVAVATVALSSIVFLIVNRSVFAPLNDLLDATRRVRAGDISTPVPVVTDDELGALAVSFNQMLADLRESRARIVAASDAARRRVERDLHDGAQQELVLLRLKLATLERRIASDPDAAPLAAELIGDLDRALRQLRDLAHGIYPQALESDGLRGALSDAAARAAIATTVDCDGAGRYPQEVEAAVYFCCLEALQNAAKHAGDEAVVTIDVGEHDGRLGFRITDDGAGFDPVTTDGAAGLQNMSDRIGAVGGHVRIDSAPGRGTTVIGTVPLDPHTVTHSSAPATRCI